MKITLKQGWQQTPQGLKAIWTKEANRLKEAEFSKQLIQRPRPLEMAWILNERGLTAHWEKTNGEQVSQHRKNARAKQEVYKRQVESESDIHILTPASFSTWPGL